MNFDGAMRRHWPTAWFRLKFFKYKYRGRGEPELALIRLLVEPGTTALDCGCSIGMYAMEMARYAAKVIAFEANPRVAACTAHVTPRNVEVINVALSSAPGRATLRIPYSGKGKGIDELGTIEPASPMHAAAGDNIGVEMQRLDDFGITNCSFVKIDVEAHEEAMLEGASNLIAMQRPVLMIELDEGVNPGTVRRVAARLTAQNYRGLFLSRGAMHPVAEFDASKHQDQSLLRYTRKTLPAHLEYINNFVFLPEEKGARILARL
jgi:FkbM family methyltransferase